jgi:hypothetical protein
MCGQINPRVHIASITALAKESPSKQGQGNRAGKSSYFLTNNR